MLAVSLLNDMGESITKNFNMSKVISVTEIEGIKPEWQQKSMDIANTMWEELGTIDIEFDVKNVDTPMLLIAGAKDIMVPFSILKNGYNNYGGEKEYLILEQSNHMMFVDEPELFVSKVISFYQK